jgi:hypothetical protein
VSSASTEITAARRLTEELAAKLERAPSFQQLAPGARTAVLRDLRTIQQSLLPANRATAASVDPYSFALDTPDDLAARLQQARRGGNQPANGQAGADGNGSQPSTPGPRKAATETLAARAGALSDEINFPAFVAGLVHGTFDAIVDASIRQMEAFADLVSAVARNTADFTRDNVTANQARDWLVTHYPQDLVLDTSGTARVVPKRAPTEGSDEEPESPEWLADFDLAGEPLTTELIEEKLVPAARQRVGESRLQTLATMVLLGMNRVIVRDGTISARVRFRAAATDNVGVTYAASQDPGSGMSWGNRGGASQVTHATMVSTVGVNAQADTDLKAELFGEVKINFVSETLPLDRFADQARITLLERNARTRIPPKSGSAAAETPGAMAPGTPIPPAAPPAPVQTPASSPG